jgi:Tfp pilus assembly protein PilZ
VLTSEGRTHIVGLADVSVTGAYVTTQAPLTEGALCSLAISIPFDHPELRLAARVVRVIHPTKWPQARRKGVALHFEEVDEASLTRLRQFVERSLPRR